MKTLLSITLCAGLIANIAFARGGYGHGNNNQATMTQPIYTNITTTVATLTEEQIADLLFMYEEEKMARDVYATLANIWGVPIFSNIQSAEQNHMDAIKTLLVKYNIPLPVSEDTIGVFENIEIQTLYDELVALGEESLASAYDVGIMIEETDIADLEERIVDTPADIQQVYQRLLNGSYNHLSAFNRVLDSVYYYGSFGRNKR